MGGGSYNFNTRSIRSVSRGYATKSADQIFEQNRVGRVHESMDPRKAQLRESRDSADHPRTVPIILALDHTGSMGRVPHDLIKEGLPKMMSGIISAGTPDPALLFLAVGDHIADKAPLQVGQFESGDEQLDMWLERCFLEGNGGGNGGESYLLTWYYAAFHTVTDAWDKRKEKGFLFTIGDEPSHTRLSSSALKEIMGPGEYRSFDDETLLAAAYEKWDVFHLHIAETATGKLSSEYWKKLLGERCIVIQDHRDIAATVAKIVVSRIGTGYSETPPAVTRTEDTGNVPYQGPIHNHL